MNTLRLGIFTNFANDFSKILIISHQFHSISRKLELLSTLSSMREEIHEQEVNLDNLWAVGSSNSREAEEHLSGMQIT